MNNSTLDKSSINEMNKSLEKSNSIGTLPSKYKTIDVGGSTLNT
jgi:hypothetical protein